MPLMQAVEDIRVRYRQNCLMKFDYVLKAISMEKTPKYIWFPFLSFACLSQKYYFSLFN